MVDVDEHLRREVRRAFAVGRKFTRVDQAAGAAADRLRDLRADECGRARSNHRAQRRVRFERIAEAVLARLGDEAFDESIVDVAVDVDALDGTARLPRVEVRAVDEIRDCVFERRVRSDVRGILPAELQIRRDELARRGLLHRAASVDRPGERHEGDAAVADHPGDVVVASLHVLEDASGKPRFTERFGVAIGDERRLL